jgi:hypothetical protein
MKLAGTMGGLALIAVAFILNLSGISDYWTTLFVMLGIGGLITAVCAAIWESSRVHPGVRIREKDGALEVEFRRLEDMNDFVELNAHQLDRAG